MLRSVAASSSVPRMAGLTRARTVNVGASAAVRTFVSSCRRSQASEAPQQPKMVKLTIDGKEIEVEQGTALIQACEKAGAQIPRFCYHERLLIAGNCRMCLVESKGAPKPLAACAFPAMPGQVISTNSPLVAKAREGVMEFMLANHPLDCPICDWGGECDLQDQSMRYGSDRSRMHEYTGKRAVEDKNLGPLVKTIMTRCIHCTRCVRFANDVAGVQELGTTGRGNQLQIGTYVEKMMESEMSGNIVDLCPVGALTSKPYSFQARPWELKRTESVDVLDAVGSNIRVDSRGVQVVRILPRTNDDVNEEWINDKTRHASDGLKYQRLTSPYVKQGDRLVPASWPEAFSAISQGLASSGAKGDEIKAVAGALADVESMVALKDLVNRLGSDNLTLDQPAGQLPPVHGVDFRSAYTLNTTIAGLEHADALLLIGTNPRHEGAIINTRIRKAYLHQGLDVGLIGEASDLTYEYAHLGTDAKALEDLVAGKGSEFAKKFKSAKRPMIIVGSAVYEHVDGAAVNALLGKYLEAEKSRFFAPDWQGYNVLQRTASKVGAYDVGFVPTEKASKTTAKFIYLLNADDFSPDAIPRDAFVVYQGHHGDLGAQYADVIIPGSAYTEKSTTFVNTEGRTQVTRAAVPSPGAAREDWKIVRALSEVLGVTLPYDETVDIRDRLFEISPTLVRYDAHEPVSTGDLTIAEMRRTAGKAKPTGAPLLRPISNFYMTDPISRASPTMAKCSAAFVHKVPMPDEDGRPIASLG